MCKKKRQNDETECRPYEEYLDEDTDDFEVDDFELSYESAMEA